MAHQIMNQPKTLLPKSQVIRLLVKKIQQTKTKVIQVVIKM